MYGRAALARRGIEWEAGAARGRCRPQAGPVAATALGDSTFAMRGSTGLARAGPSDVWAERHPSNFSDAHCDGPLSLTAGTTRKLTTTR